MIVPEPPVSQPCAACRTTPEQVWVRSLNRWVGLVPAEHGTWRVHDCRPRRYTPPTPAYVEAKTKIAAAKEKRDG